MTSTSLFDFTDRSEWDGKYVNIVCKKALSPSKLPEMDYALNPYGGCEHGCIYCYAPEVTHKDWDTWRVVRVKVNVADRLEREIDHTEGIIGIGTVTDPYQYAEKRFNLTRNCLEIIERHSREIHIHTKSDLITRDIDLLGRIKSKIAVTITSVDDSFSKVVEPGAPLPEKRLFALKQLTDAGLNTYVLIGPVLSSLRGKEEEFCQKIIETGVKTAYIDKLNERPLLFERLSRKSINGSDISVKMIRSLLVESDIVVKNVF